MGSTSISQPAPPAAPSIGQTTQESIDAQLSSLPQQLQAEREFGPQFSQASLDLARQFAPEVSQLQLDLQRQFGPDVAQQMVAERDLLTPEVAAGQQALISFLGGGANQRFQEGSEAALQDFLSGEEVLTDAQKRNTQQDIRAGQNTRGFAIASPLGSLDEARQLEGLRQNIRQNRFQAATGVLGSQLTASQQLASQAAGAAGSSPAGFGMQQQQPSFFQSTAPSLTSGPTSAQAFGLAQSNYSTGANIFGTQSSNYQNQPSSPLGAIGSAGLAGFSGGLSGGLTRGIGGLELFGG